MDNGKVEGKLKDKSLKVLIVGCGNIAGRFDMLNLSNSHAQTHAGAYIKNPNFAIVGCIDPDQEKRAEFMNFWQVDKGYDNFEQVISSDIEYDVVSICSPTNHHEVDILSSIELNPKLIFCEKPISSSFSSSESLAMACEKASIPLAVNYSRRWDTRCHELFIALKNAQYGELRSVVGTYNKGVLNNGSHLIDLLELLLGELTITSIGRATNDYLEDDPSISAVLETNDGVPINLVTGNAKDYSLFEIQFIFEKAMVTMQDGGASWYLRERAESNVYSGYFSLDSGKQELGAYAEVMENAIANIHGHLFESEALLSTAKNSLVAQRLCEDLRNRF